MKANPKAQSPKRPAGAAGGYRIVSFPKEFERGLFGDLDIRFYLILISSLVVVYSVVIILANLEYTDQEVADLLKQKYIQRIYDAEFEIQETEDENAVVEEAGGGDGGATP